MYKLFEGKKAAYFTLGCKLNFAETSTVGQQLRKMGVSTAARGEVADICIINTCSVTEVADQKCRQAIHRLVKHHPGALVIVTGCYAQLKPQQVAAIEGVDLVLGAEEKGQMLEHIARRLEMMPEERALAAHEHHTVRTADIRTFMPSCSCGDRTRYFLKVQDGCDYYCTYCTIPKARGRSRNGSIASLVEQAREAAAQGGREIVITGVNIGDFGRTTGESFLDLIKALDAVEGIERYRISSIEPNLLTEEVIDFCARSRAFMPHFHIPLQSGSDEVLRLMDQLCDEKTHIFVDPGTFCTARGVCEKQNAGRLYRGGRDCGDTRRDGRTLCRGAGLYETDRRFGISCVQLQRAPGHDGIAHSAQRESAGEARTEPAGNQSERGMSGCLLQPFHGPGASGIA